MDTKNIILNLKQGAFFEDSGLSKHLHYSPAGETLAYSIGKKLKIYNTTNAKLKNCLSINAPMFDYALENNILHPQEKTIKYLSLFDNKYISTYQGHTSNVDYISSSTIDDRFISSCVEGVKMWDLRYKDPIYKLDILNCISAFVGEKFIVIYNSTMKIYDFRVTQSPIREFIIPYDRYTRITACDGFFAISGIRTHVVYRSNGDYHTTIKTDGESFCCFTPDSNHFVCSAGYECLFYDLEAKKKMHRIFSDKAQFGIIDFNPSFAQMAVAKEDVYIWMSSVI